MNASTIINYGVYQLKKSLLWDHYYNNVSSPKHKGPVINTQEDVQEIVHDLKKNGFDVREYVIDVEDYKNYLAKAQYQRYKYDKQNHNIPEKSLEHYLAFKFLELTSNDVYIDIANCTSPSPDIYNAFTGCKVYRQDLSFPEGINGNIIGGDAGNLPLPDQFASKMALHCSFEHFEGDSDIRFIKEASRVLTPGGKVCIVPFYLSPEYAIQNDPVYHKLNVENEAICYCAKGWRNRHGRFYDVEHLMSRIRNNLGTLKLTIYIVQNEKEVDTSCYVKFIGLLEK